MTERNFLLERLMERAFELQAKHRGNHGTYLVELAKVMMQTARNEKERREAEIMLKEMRTAQRFSLFGPNEDDKREEVIEQVRATLKARHPFIRFYVMRGGPRTSRRWEVLWTNGPSEAEIKQLVALFARKDLTFRFLRKSEPEAAKY